VRGTKSYRASANQGKELGDVDQVDGNDSEERPGMEMRLRLVIAPAVAARGGRGVGGLWGLFCFP